MQTTLLLLDDNAVQAATRQTILRRAGYFVLCALNPQLALEQLRTPNHAEDISLVITDHIMPGMNGSVFVRELRTHLPSLPVLVLSGLEEAEQEYQGMNVEFRMKPLPPEDLLATVGKMVAAQLARHAELCFASPTPPKVKAVPRIKRGINQVDIVSA